MRYPGNGISLVPGVQYLLTGPRRSMPGSHLRFFNCYMTQQQGSSMPGTNQTPGCQASLDRHKKFTSPGRHQAWKFSRQGAQGANQTSLKCLPHLDAFLCVCFIDKGGGTIAHLDGGGGSSLERFVEFDLIDHKSVQKGTSWVLFYVVVGLCGVKKC